MTPVPSWLHLPVDQQLYQEPPACSCVFDNIYRARALSLNPYPDTKVIKRIILPVGAILLFLIAFGFLFLSTGPTRHLTIILLTVESLRNDM